MPEEFASLQDLSYYINSDKPDRVLTGLTRFIKQIKSNFKTYTPCTLLEEYLKSSPKLSELFTIITTSDKSYKLVSKTFELLALIISPHTLGTSRSVAIEAARRVLRKHMKVLYWLLSAEDHRVVASSLQLLVGMVQLGQTSSLAREVSTTFDFAFKPFLRLPFKAFNKSEKQVEQALEVRKLFIDFALAFLESTDVELVRAVLNVKGFVSSIFKDLVRDSADTVKEVLEAVQVSVLQQPSISVATRTMFFNRFMLEQLLKLYDGSEMHANLAHKFMKTLLTTTAAAGRRKAYLWKHQRQLLLHLLSTLRANEHLRQQQLALSILETNPQLTPTFLRQLSYSYDPRLSFRWLANVNLLVRLHSLPVGDLTSSSTNQLLSYVFPGSLSKASLSHGLKNNNVMVRHTSMKLLQSVFRRYAKLAPLVRGTSTETKFREAFRKYLPDMQVVFGLRVLVVDSEISHSLLLSILFSYQSHLPEVVLESRVDVWKFISCEAEDLSPLCQYQLVKLLRQSGSMNPRLWARQKDANPKPNTQPPTNFGRLLRLFTCVTGAVRTLLQTFLIEILRDSGVFGSVGSADSISGQLRDSEMGVWLTSLDLESTSYFEALVFKAINSHEDDSFRVFAADNSYESVSALTVFSFTTAQAAAVHVHRYLYRVCAQLLHLSAPCEKLVKDLQALLSNSQPSKKRKTANGQTNISAYSTSQYQALSEFVSRRSGPVGDLFTFSSASKAKKKKRGSSALTLEEAQDQLEAAIKASNDDQLWTVLAQVEPSVLDQLLPWLSQSCPTQILVEYLLTYCEVPLFGLPSLRTLAQNETGEGPLFELAQSLPWQVVTTHAFANQCKHLAATSDLVLTDSLLVHDRLTLLRLLVSAIEPGTSDSHSPKVLAAVDRACSLLEDIVASLKESLPTQSEAVCQGLTSFLTWLFSGRVVSLSSDSPTQCVLILAVVNAIWNLPLTDPTVVAAIQPLVLAIATQARTLPDQMSRDRFPRPLLLLRMLADYIPLPELAVVAEALLSAPETVQVSMPESPADLSPRLRTILLLSEHKPLSHKLLSQFPSSVSVLTSVMVQLRGRASPRLDQVCRLLLSTADVDRTVAVNRDTLDALLNNLTADRAHFAALLLSGRLSSHFCGQFAQLVCGHWQRWTEEQQQWLLPAICAYLSSAHVILSSQVGSEDKTLRKLLVALAGGSLLPWALGGSGEIASDSLKTAQLLCRQRVLSPSLQLQLLDKVVRASKKGLAPAQVQLCSALLGPSTTSPASIGPVVSRGLRTLSDMFKVKKLAAGSSSAEEAELAALMQRLLDSLLATGNGLSGLRGVGLEELVKSVNRFCANTVRFRLQEEPALSLLDSVLRASVHVEGVIPANVLYDLLVSSSSFIEMVLYPSSQLNSTPVSNKASPGSELKAALLRVLHTMFTSETNAPSNEASAHTNLVRVLLAGYQGTDCPNDRRTLAMLKVLDWGDLQGAEANCRNKWGAAGIAHLQATINDAVKSDDVDTDVSQWVFQNFDRRMLGRGPALDFSVDKEAGHGGELRYDPTFVLPFLRSFLRDTQLDLRKAIQMNIVSYVVKALSCQSQHVRKLAYKVVSLIYEVLESFSNTGKEGRKRANVMQETFPESPQVQVLMNILKEAITEKFQQIPNLATTFVARAVPIMLNPGLHMYKSLNRFALQRPMLDLADVPMFYGLFNSSSEHHKAERNWVLWMLFSGLARADDYEAAERRFVFPLLMAFHDSAASDDNSRDLILKILERACSHLDQLLVMAERHALFAWLRLAISAKPPTRTMVLLVRTAANTLHSAAADSNQVQNVERVRKEAVALASAMLPVLDGVVVTEAGHDAARTDQLTLDVAESLMLCAEASGGVALTPDLVLSLARKAKVLAEAEVARDAESHDLADDEEEEERLAKDGDSADAAAEKKDSRRRDRASRAGKDIMCQLLNIVSRLSGQPSLAAMRNDAAWAQGVVRVAKEALAQLHQHNQHNPTPTLPLLHTFTYWLRTVVSSSPTVRELLVAESVDNTSSTFEALYTLLNQAGAQEGADRYMLQRVLFSVNASFISLHLQRRQGGQGAGELDSIVERALDSLPSPSVSMDFPLSGCDTAANELVSLAFNVQQQDGAVSYKDL